MPSSTSTEDLCHDDPIMSKMLGPWATERFYRFTGDGLDVCLDSIPSLPNHRERTVRQAGCTCSVGPVPRCSSTLKAFLSSGAFLYFSVFAIMAHLNRAPYRAGYDYSNPNPPQLFPIESTGWENPPWAALYVCVTRFAFMRVYAPTDFVHRRRTRLRLNQ